MALKIILQRNHEVSKVSKPGVKGTEPSTIGILKVFDGDQNIFECYTVENGGDSSEEVGKDKRIMPGFYSLTYSNTSVPLPKSLNRKGILLNKPDNPHFARRRIFIHMGNYPQDTLGCILLAKKYDMQKKIGIGFASRLAINQFYAIMGGVDLRQVSLEIKELKDENGRNIQSKEKN